MSGSNLIGKFGVVKNMFKQTIKIKK